jgi:dihydroxyacetone kinase
LIVKHFINTRDTIVTEALDGLAALGPGLARLDGYPHIKVLTRAQIDAHKVAVVSGGGAGHEPAHAGFVGRGLLSAAVSGEIFASPSVEAVLAGILAVTGEAGCVLIVKNYTGDRLNFGLAAERARAIGRRVETVLVADDIAIPDPTRRRGVAGTLFVHKIAGHLAERGADLDTVAALARAAAAEIWSLGVSLDSCTIPGAIATDRLAADEGELGLGIHGEPGVEKIGLQPVRSIVALMVERLMAALPEGPHRYAALINNLGAVPAIEMSVIVHELLQSRVADRIELVIGPAPMMTSLDMNGFSLSLLRLDDARREALLGDCDVVAWPGAAVPKPVEVRPLPSRSPRTRAPASSDPQVERGLGGESDFGGRGLEKSLSALLERMIAMQAELDLLDARIGDGDTGTTFATGARAVRERFANLPFGNSHELLAELADVLGESMGGSVGVLLSIGCMAASQARARGDSWVAALGEGVARIREYGGAQPGDRTMLDALIPAMDALNETGDVRAAADAARAGAEATASLVRAKAGRAAYLSAESLAGTPDPGAMAIAAAFEAVSAEQRR